VVKQTNKEKLSITLDLDVFEYVSDLADKDSRSLSSMINVLLKGMMEKENK
jgi:macrodomain Ter protein organizer (MatP/YcbG family)